MQNRQLLKNHSHWLCLNQTNIKTLNITTGFFLQPAIEANCKRPTAYSPILRLTAEQSRNIIYCLLQKPYFNGLWIDDMQISIKNRVIMSAVISGDDEQHSAYFH